MRDMGLGGPKFKRRLTDPTDGVSPKKGAPFWGGSQNKDCSILGPMKGSHYFGKVPNSSPIDYAERSYTSIPYFSGKYVRIEEVNPHGRPYVPSKIVPITHPFMKPYPSKSHATSRRNLYGKKGPLGGAPPRLRGEGLGFQWVFTPTMASFGSECAVSILPLGLRRGHYFRNPKPRNQITEPKFQNPENGPCRSTQLRQSLYFPNPRNAGCLHPLLAGG